MRRRLIKQIDSLARRDMEVYENLITVGGMLWHLEWEWRRAVRCRQKLNMPVIPSAQYAIERIVL